MMSKVKREKVAIYSSYYNFDQKYEDVMKQFDDKKIISINVISATSNGDSIREEYLVFYEELQEEIEEDLIEKGDLVYSHDVNTRARIYETVEKVVFEDGIDKCYTIEEDSSERGWHELKDVTLVSKKKDRKDI